MARPSRQPGTHLRVLVRRIVVTDQMDIEVFRHLLIDVFEEGDKPLVPMASLAPGQHFTTADIGRCKPRGRAIA